MRFSFRLRRNENNERMGRNLCINNLCGILDMLYIIFLVQTNCLRGLLKMDEKIREIVEGKTKLEKKQRALCVASSEVFDLGGAIQQDILTTKGTLIRVQVYKYDWANSDD